MTVWCLLEGLVELEGKWAVICETSDDPDEVADYGNDLGELRSFLQRLRPAAVERFGFSVVNTSREPL